MTESECVHCGRRIVQEQDRWLDPEATGDDTIWSETCDAHDSFVAEHEPPPLQTYLVEWSMNIDAREPQDAARQALGIHRDPGSIATVFHIYGDDGSDTIIDIEDPNEPITLGKEAP